jgi:hypothetical protein
MQLDGTFKTNDSAACMRMRRLGKGQSVVFLVNHEIKTRIQECTRKDEPSEVSLSDVLRWTIHETHLDIRRSLPLWAKQGINFFRQSTLWNDLENSGQSSSAVASQFLEPEARSLESRYRPCQPGKVYRENLVIDRPELRLIDHRLQHCLCCGDIGDVLEEEQERELSPEMQEERQIQKPGPAIPSKHLLHPDVLAFATTGSAVETSVAYQSAFTCLKRFSAASIFDIRELNGSGILYATEDFARTVEPAPGSHFDDSYLRSVQWILVSSVPKEHGSVPAMVISPFEAQQLMSKLRKDSPTALYIFKPHWNTGLPVLNRLDFFHFPPSKTTQRLWPESMAQLNIFAGSSCFGTFQEYVDTCAFLRLTHEETKEGVVTSNDGFILADERNPSNTARSPHRSPVTFVQALLHTRAHHRDLAKSHMGKVMGGVVLRKSDVEEERSLAS